MNSEKNKNNLGEAPISGLIAKYAIPAIFAMLITSAYNITDQIFIGQKVGMLGNAATNVVFPVVMLSGAFAMLIGGGTAANFNIRMGAKKENEAANFLGTGIVTLVLLGILSMVVVLLFKTPLLMLTGATESVLPLASSYLWITALGMPFFTFSMATSVIIRADGSPTYSMISSVIGAVLNVFLDWLFMFVFNLGIEGAAIATVIGQIVSFGMCVFYLTRFKSFKIKLSMFRIKSSYLFGILRIGSTNFINQMIMAVVAIIMNNTLKYYGGLSVYGSDIPLAVSGVIAKINMLFAGIMIGIAQGCQPIFGFNMDAKNYGRIKEIYKKALVVMLSVGILAFLAFQLFPRPIISIFGVGNELYFEFAERYLRIFMMFVFVMGVQPFTMNYFTSTGKPKPGIVLALSRQVLFLIPLLLVLPLIFGIDGLLYAGPIADGLAFLLSIVLVTRDFKKMTALQAQN